MSQAIAIAHVFVEYVFSSDGARMTQPVLTIDPHDPHLHHIFSLSETFHMIDQCDDNIAGWSDQGDSFVVKNVDQFAAVSTGVCGNFCIPTHLSD